MYVHIMYCVIVIARKNFMDTNGRLCTYRYKSTFNLGKWQWNKISFVHRYCEEEHASSMDSRGRCSAEQQEENKINIVKENEVSDFPCFSKFPVQTQVLVNLCLCLFVLLLIWFIVCFLQWRDKQIHLCKEAYMYTPALITNYMSYQMKYWYVIMYQPKLKIH